MSSFSWINNNVQAIALSAFDLIARCCFHGPATATASLARTTFMSRAQEI